MPTRVPRIPAVPTGESILKLDFLSNFFNVYNHVTNVEVDENICMNLVLPLVLKVLQYLGQT